MENAPQVERPKIVAIEGGRAIKAREVREHMLDKSDACSNAFDNMAGFAIVVWDDEGQTHTATFQGTRCPFAPSLVPQVVRYCVARNVGGDVQ